MRELKRFREREPLVDTLIEDALDVVSDPNVPGNGPLRDAVEAVHDFKVTDNG